MVGGNQRSIQHGIQILRAVMLIMVLLSHFVGMLPGNNELNNTPIRLLWSGNCAVIGFFMLSGYNYSRTFLNRKKLRDIIDIVVVRLIRLVPITIISICLANMMKYIYLQLEVGSLPLSDWGNSFWLTKNSISDYLSITSVNPSLWTMAIEIKYVVFVVCVMLIDRIINKSKFSIIFKVLLLSVLLIFGYFNRFMYLFVFYAGILCYECYGNKKWDISKCFQVSVVIIGVILLWSGFLFEEGFVGRNVLFCAGWSLILVIVKDKISHKLIVKLFERLGDYSFYIYLIHFPMLLFFRFIMFSNSIGCWISYFICFIICSLVMGYVICVVDKKVTHLLKNVIWDRVKDRIFLT